MKITALEWGRVSIPLRTPFKTALRTVASVEDIILRIDTDTEHVGFGEAPPTGVITGDTAEGICGALKNHLAPALLGREAEDFETLMQRTVFEPLGITATYYPQKVQGDLADAVRILPRSKTPNFNAAERRSRPLPPMEVDLERHYNLAHGNLYISAPELARLGIAAMMPGFLSQESLKEMRNIAVPFGERAHNLSQGLFTFVLNEPKICERLIYGHQGMAYGAVHGLFFDPSRERGMALLTTGASEARRGVLADLNFDLMKTLWGGG